jgi:hypothetical protein
MLVKVYFFYKGPGRSQIPGLLSHGPQIPDRTINHCKQQTYVQNFSDNPSKGTPAIKIPDYLSNLVFIPTL